MEKILRENTKYSRNETILKIGHLAKAIAHVKAIYSLCKMVSLGLKLKKAKTSEPNSTGTLQLFCGKILRENTKYSRNERIFKIGHLAKAIAHAKAIAFAKWSVCVKN